MPEVVPDGWALEDEKPEGADADNAGDNHDGDNHAGDGDGTDPAKPSKKQDDTDSKDHAAINERNRRLSLSFWSKDPFHSLGMHTVCDGAVHHRSKAHDVVVLDGVRKSTELAWNADDCI